MKRWINIAIAIALFFCLHNQAYAGNRGVNGLIIGGGAGALVGQAIGRNVESTVLGATVGGILGAVIGAEHGNRHHRTVVVHERPRRPQDYHYNHSPRHNSPRVVFSQPHNYGKKYYKNSQRQKNTPHKKHRVHYSKPHKNQPCYNRPYRSNNRR